MKSVLKRLSSKKQQKNKILRMIILIIIISLPIGGRLLTEEPMEKLSGQTTNISSLENKKINQKEQEIAQVPDEANSEEKEQGLDGEKEKFTDIRIAAAGDIMFHDTQLISGYNEKDKTYNFNSMFEDIKPIFSVADMAIANLETTLSGEAPYTGYPQFNSPDEVIDAIKYAGVDVLVTANNHSLDTHDTGLKRTVDIVRSKGIDTVGTYSGKDDSRVLIKDIKGVKIAIVAYTESTNGLGAQYPKEKLDAMINLMEKDQIIKDIHEAKKLDPDFIIAFMHWGDEYAPEPNARQFEFAQMMADEGVDLILGSHPHVIQKSEVIESNGKKTYVVYSMGNLISNQRRETLGENFVRTEDGIIINFDIRKNNKTDETIIWDVEYIPTWVYRHREEGQAKYTYRVLPIKDFLSSSEISNTFKRRMENSLEATVSKMVSNPFGKD